MTDQKTSIFKDFEDITGLSTSAVHLLTKEYIDSLPEDARTYTASRSTILRYIDGKAPLTGSEHGYNYFMSMGPAKKQFFAVVILGMLKNDHYWSESISKSKLSENELTERKRTLIAKAEFIANSNKDIAYSKSKAIGFDDILRVAAPYSILSVPLIYLIAEKTKDKIEIVSYAEDRMNKKVRTLLTKNLYSCTDPINTEHFIGDEVKGLLLNDENGSSLIYSSQELFNFYKSKGKEEAPRIDCFITDNITIKELGGDTIMSPLITLSGSIEGTCKPLILASSKLNNDILLRYGERNAYDYELMAEFVEKSGSNVSVISSSSYLVKSYTHHYFTKHLDKDFKDHFDLKKNVIVSRNFEGMVMELLEILQVSKKVVKRIQALFDKRPYDDVELKNVLGKALCNYLNSKENPDMILILDHHPQLHWLFDSLKSFNTAKKVNDGRRVDKSKFGVLIEELSDFFPKVIDPLTIVSLYGPNEMEDSLRDQLLGLITELRNAIGTLNQGKKQIDYTFPRPDLQEIAKFLNMDYDSFYNVFKKINYLTLYHEEGMKLLCGNINGKE